MRAVTKTSFKEWQALPPLSLVPTHSRGESENGSPSQSELVPVASSETIGRLESRQQLFPLPRGDGQAEGESQVKSPAKLFGRP
jgi:hypothetical protein